MSSGHLTNRVDEVDELHATDDAPQSSFDVNSSVGNLPRAPLSAHQQHDHEQSDSMRNLLIVESAGRSTLFLIESVVALLSGASLLILSMAVVIVLPLMYSDAAESYPISINVHNCWAYGLWLPFLVVAWATLMLKAAKTGCAKYFIIFYCLCALATVCCAVVVVLRCIYYASAWYQALIDQPNLTPKRQFGIQIACDLLCLVLLLEGFTVLCMYLGAFRRQCGQPDHHQLARSSRNLFV